MRLLMVSAAEVGLLVAIGAGLGIAAPDPGDDPAPQQAFAVRPGAGSCVPNSFYGGGPTGGWEQIVLEPPALKGSAHPVELVCTLQVGPGELPIEQLARVTVYGFNASKEYDVSARICVAGLMLGGGETCGNDAKSNGFGKFVTSMSPPDVAGMSDRTAAYLRIDLSGGPDQLESEVTGFVIEVL